MLTSLKNSPYSLTYIWTAKSFSFSFKAFQMKTLKQFFQKFKWEQSKLCILVILKYSYTYTSKIPKDLKIPNFDWKK